MRAAYRTLICLVALSVSASSAAQGAKSDIDYRALERRIDTLHAAYTAPHSPGAIVAVIDHGEVRLLKSYGLANREHEVRWTPETQYTFFSLTKSMVSLALVRLANAGRISLDDSIYKYLPGDRRLNHDIKVRALLNHTSGLWQDEILALIAGLNPSDNAISLDELHGLMQKQSSLPYRPGSNFYYNDGGMRLAALVLERASGKSFPDAMRELVFEPAGMKTATTKLYEPSYVRSQATPYLLDVVDRTAGPNGPLRVATGLFENSGDGAALGSTKDLIAYARYLSGYVDKVRWIDKLTPATELQPGYVAPYRLGMIAASHRGVKALMHGGYMGKKLIYLPELDVWILFMRNALDYRAISNNQRAEDLIDAVLESSSFKVPGSAGSRSRAGETLTAPGDQGFSQEELERLSGRFQDPVSRHIISLTPREEAGVMRLATRFFGETGYLERIGHGNAERFRTYANGHNGSPNPVTVSFRDGGVWMRYADWPSERRLTKIAAETFPVGLAGHYRSSDLNNVFEIRRGSTGLELLVSSGNRIDDRFKISPMGPDVVEAAPINPDSGRPAFQVRVIRSAGSVTRLLLDTDNIKDLALDRVTIEPVRLGTSRRAN